MSITSYAGPALAITLSIAAFAIHEFGHWVAMRRAGIEIDAVGIGFSPPRCKRWTKRICGIPFLFGMLPLGGYLRKTKEGQRRFLSLPYHEQALINGAGIMANIFFSAFILDSLLFIDCRASWRMLNIPLFWEVTIPPILIWFGRRIFCNALPIVGIGTVVWIAITSVHSGGGPVLVGPVGLARYVVHGSPTLLSGAIQGALISLMWGALNAVPFVPTDGWHTFAAFLRKHRPGWVQPLFDVEFAIYAVTLIVVLGHDLRL